MKLGLTVFDLPACMLSMTRLSLTFYEIIDKDFTGIVATLTSARQPALHFANFDRTAEVKPVYSNQTEEFVFPSRKSALRFMASNACFHAVDAQQESEE